MTYEEYVKDLENANSIITILDRHLFCTHLPKYINEFAQRYNKENKILKTHSSFFSLV